MIPITGVLPWLAVAVASLAGAVGIPTYRYLLRLGAEIDQAWVDLERLLTQRDQHLSGLVAAAEDLLDTGDPRLRDLQRAWSMSRAAHGPSDAAGADQVLRSSIGQLAAAAEEAPTAEMGPLPRLLSRVMAAETEIAEERDAYNREVALFNSRLEELPFRLLLGLPGVQEREAFEAPA